MPAYYWIKLWIDLLDDYRMASLPDHLWRRAIEMFLLARTGGGDGYLPPIHEVAWKLRISPDTLEADLAELEELTSRDGRHGIIQHIDGAWFVTNFAKRQAGVSDKERQRRKRERDRDNIPISHGAVTVCDLEAEAEADEQTTEAEEQQQTPDAVAAAVQAMEAHGMTNAQDVLTETALTPAQLLGNVSYAKAQGLGAGWLRTEARQNRAHSPPDASRDRRRFIEADYVQH